MPEEILKIKEEDRKYQNLPEKIRDYFADETTINRLIVLEKKYQLSFDQINRLIRILRRILIREIKLADLPQALEKELILDNQTAEVFARELIEQIFKPIAEILRVFYNQPLSMDNKPEPKLEGNVVNLKDKPEI